MGRLMKTGALPPYVLDGAIYHVFQPFIQVFTSLSIHQYVYAVGSKVGAYVRGQPLPIFPEYRSQIRWPTAGAA